MKEHRQLLWRAVERYLPQVLQDLLLVLTLLLCIGQQPVDLGAEEDLDLEHGQRGGNKKGIVVTKGKRAYLQKVKGPYYKREQAYPTLCSAILATSVVSGYRLEMVPTSKSILVPTTYNTQYIAQYNVLNTLQNTIQITKTIPPPGRSWIFRPCPDASAGR